MLETQTTITSDRTIHTAESNGQMWRVSWLAGIEGFGWSLNRAEATAAVRLAAIVGDADRAGLDLKRGDRLPGEAATLAAELELDLDDAVERIHTAQWI